MASLAVVLPGSGPESGSSSGPDGGRVYLIDATPDLPEQLEALADVRDPPAGRVDRAPVDGVLLTHAHVGHYLGLAWFGFESLHTRGLPVWCTPRMARFLRENGPWSQLVRPAQRPAASNPRRVPLGNVELRELDPGGPGGGGVELGAAVHAGHLRVLFTHLNHSNPALDPESPERRPIEAAGFRVAEEGEEIPL